MSILENEKSKRERERERERERNFTGTIARIGEAEHGSC